MPLLQPGLFAAHYPQIEYGVRPLPIAIAQKPPLLAKLSMAPLLFAS